MENIIVLFEVTIKDGKIEYYLKRANELKEYLKILKVSSEQKDFQA